MLRLVISASLLGLAALGGGTEAWAEVVTPSDTHEAPPPAETPAEAELGEEADLEELAAPTGTAPRDAMATEVPDLDARAEAPPPRPPRQG
ncbi:MAG: hypothetical protein AAF845_15165 [Bacteroidota bacterium]